MSNLDETKNDSSVIKEKIISVARNASEASDRLLNLSTEKKNAILREIALLLRADSVSVLRKNAEDVERFKNKKGANPAFLDRLLLTEERIEGIIKCVENVIELPDPCYQVLEERKISHNGLLVKKVSCPIGALAIIYEARPNVTIDAAVLCIKSGNSCVLKGGSDSMLTNIALADIVNKAFANVGLSSLAGAVEYLDILKREDLGILLQCKDYIDLVVPRGGRGLVEFVSNNTSIPTLKHLDGNCHTYIENSASPEKASQVLVNAKMRRVSICSATESLVVDREIATKHLPMFVDVLRDAGCDEFVGDAEACEIDSRIMPCVEGDFREEFLSAKISVKIVNNFDEAICHINKYSSKHTEAIVSNNPEAISKFSLEIKSALVMLNASTQFSDGFELGLGAEIGISNGKMHARGPIGLRELNTFKYVVEGDYTLRK